jgi:hypothetical protein
VVITEALGRNWVAADLAIMNRSFRHVMTRSEQQSALPPASLRVITIRSGKVKAT